MADWQRVIGRKGVRGGPRRRRLVRWLVQLALVIVGLVVFLPATDDSVDADVSNIHFAVGLMVWLVAVMIPLWSAPEEGLPEPLRIRSRHRRIAWRIALLVLFAAAVALLGDAYWAWRADRVPDAAPYARVLRFTADSHHSGRAGLWLVCLWPLPGLVEPLVWRLWPQSLRRAVRCARTAEALTEPTRFPLPVGFDPDRGATGRPEAALWEEPAGPPQPDACAAPLSGGGSESGPWPERENLGPARGIPARTGAELRWDGSALTVSGKDGKPVAVPLAGRGPLPGGAGVRRPVAELVWFRERHATVRSAPAAWARQEMCLTLLDEQGHRVGTVRRVSGEWRAMADVARAAGVAFTAYDLGTAPQDRPRANSLLFPRRGHQLRLFAD